VNVTEYLEYLDSLGINENDFPAIQPVMQHRIWNKFENGSESEKLEIVIEQLKQEGDFNMEGGSWTNNISWVNGYENVLKPMEQVSAEFNRKILLKEISRTDIHFRNALYHLLLTQTSCYRYWGQGQWADFGRELCRRTSEIIEHDFS